MFCLFAMCKAPCACVVVLANLHDNTLEHSQKACSTSRLILFYHLVLCAEAGVSKYCTHLSDRSRSTAIGWR